MKRINTLFYCSIFRAGDNKPVLNKYGFTACRLLSSKDFASFMHLGYVLVVIGVYGDNTDFDDTQLLYNDALYIARENAKELLATLSMS